MKISSIDRVLIVEDHEETAKVLQKVVSKCFTSANITCSSNLQEGRSALQKARFDLALIDLGLPDGNGLELIREIADKSPTFIVVTTIFDDEEHLFESLKSGAHGYLLKGHQEDEITDFLRGILDGRPPLSPSIAYAVLKHFRVMKDNKQGKSNLTERETEVLQLIAKGCHVTEVSEMLEIASSTVSAHVKKIYQKLDIHNRAEATAAAVNLNLYNP